MITNLVFLLRILEILNIDIKFTHLLAGAKRNIKNIEKIEKRVAKKDWIAK